MKGELEWIKVNVDSFDNNKIRLISHMPQGDSVICIWFRLLLEAGKNNDEGYIYMNESIPYTFDMLGKIFDRSIKKVKYAIDILKKFMMIEVDEDNFIRIKNWNKYQSADKLEAIRESGRERTRRCRAKKKAAMEAEKLQEENNLKKAEFANEYFQEAAIDSEFNKKGSLLKELKEYDGEPVSKGSLLKEFEEYSGELAGKGSHLKEREEYDGAPVSKGNLLKECEEYSEELAGKGSSLNEFEEYDGSPVSKGNLLKEREEYNGQLAGKGNLLKQFENKDREPAGKGSSLKESEEDIGEFANEDKLVKELEEYEYPEELQYKNSNGRCNVTCNAENVTVTDKIKSKRKIKIKNKTKEGEKEQDIDLDKETNTNYNLKLSSNVTQNSNERYSVTNNNPLQKRDDKMKSSALLNSSDNSLTLRYDSESLKNQQEQLVSSKDTDDKILKHSLAENDVSNNSADNIDHIIEEILNKNEDIKYPGMDIAYAMCVFYGNYTGNNKWLKVDDIRWQLIEHDWKDVKAAIEIVIAAGNLEFAYVNRLLAKWKEERHLKDEQI